MCRKGIPKLSGPRQARQVGQRRERPVRRGAAVSVRRIAGAPVALVDHARTERPGLDQVQRDAFGDRRQERRAATDDDRIAEQAQLVDEAKLDRPCGIGVLFDLYDDGGPVKGIATIPEIIWELSLGIYPLVWGFKSSPILSEEGRPILHPAVEAR